VDDRGAEVVDRPVSAEAKFGGPCAGCGVYTPCGDGYCQPCWERRESDQKTSEGARTPSGTTPLHSSTPGGGSEEPGATPNASVAEAEKTWGRLSFRERTPEEEREMAVARDVVLAADVAKSSPSSCPDPSDEARARAWLLGSSGYDTVTATQLRTLAGVIAEARLADLAAHAEQLDDVRRETIEACAKAIEDDALRRKDPLDRVYQRTYAAIVRALKGSPE
jgi:hypothetical protein